MSLPKCAGVINNEYYYLNGSSFLFPNRADPASKTAITDSNIDFIFDHGCVFDGYKSTYLLGISSSDSTNIISYRVSTLEKDNGTISIDKDDKLEFSHIPDFSQQVLFISRNNNADSEWCALYNSNDSDVGNTIWEDCSQTDNPTNITKTSNISNLNTWVAGASNSIIYQLTNTSLSQYNASTSNITHEKTYVLNNEISLTPNSPWSFTVAGYSKLLEFAVTDGVSVQTVSIPYDSQDRASATVNLMNSTGVDPNSSYVFSNNENSILQTINGNGINQLAALSQNSVTQTSTTGSADPTSTTAVPSQTNMSQDHHLSTGQIVGISVGSGVGFLLFIGIAILFLFVLPKRRRTRKQGGLSMKTTSTSSIMNSSNSIHAYGDRSVGQDTLSNSEEGDPDFADRLSIFNNSCGIQADDGPVMISEGVFLRKCTYSQKETPAMIHYFTSEQKEQFDQSLKILNNSNGHSDGVLQLFKTFTLPSPSPKYQIEHILISSRYEPKNNLRILYAREGDLHNYIDLSDDVFKVWVIHSILTALHALHHKNLSHGHLSLGSFFAETSAPSLDWRLGDFYTLMNNPQGKADDILRAGHMIYDIVFEQAPQTQESDYSNISLDTSKIQGPYKEHYAYLLDHTFYPNNSRQTSAESLLDYWTKHFRFS